MEPKSRIVRVAHHMLWLSLLVLVVGCCSTGLALAAAAPPPLKGPTLLSPSACLMEASTGEMLFEKDAHRPLPPASITKVMSMLLVMEALDSGRIGLKDEVVASENACSKGGSQIFLEPGEVMTVETLLKSVAVASGNDACVALAEYVAGTEEGFVDLMNARAKQLGLKDSHFVNTNGLPPDSASEPGSLTSAYDVALMSRELMKHARIREFLTIWMEPIRDGKFMLSNTNKLVRFYPGADGVKTGYTLQAKHCLSATALREGVRMIAVVLAAPDSKTRFAEASQLLNLGFAHFKSIQIVSAHDFVASARVLRGAVDSVPVRAMSDFSAVVRKTEDSSFEKRVRILRNLTAPVRKGQRVGQLVATKSGRVLGRVDLVAGADIRKASFFKVLWDTMKQGVRSIFRASPRQ